MFGKEWLVNTLNSVFLAFIGPLTGASLFTASGAFSLASLRVTMIAAVGAGVIALQSCLAQLVPGNNPTSSLPRALAARVSVPSAPLPPTEVTLSPESIAALISAIRSIPPPAPPAA